MHPSRAFPVLIALCLVGCGKDGGAGPVAATAGHSSGRTATLSADPDSVEACHPGKHPSSLLRWDATDSGASAVVLTVFNPKDGSEKQFGRGGPVGSKQSGPWLRQGVVFKLRNADTKAELASVTIKTVSCK